jgi:hypothetical protein
MNTNNHFPDFFAAAPRITVHDPLAEFLGAADDGLIEYSYADVVKLAGHSCPTVASAFLMARAGLAALYPGTLPERGGVRVDMPEPADEGVSGVIGSVIGMITGAAGAGGFHGIGGRFDRRALLAFGLSELAGPRMSRIDTGAAVSVFVRAERVPGDPRMRGLLQLCMTGAATPDEAAQFRALWQDRVRRLLVDHGDDPQLVVVETL